MTIDEKSGWGAMCLAATGGVVSPSIRQKKLLNALIANFITNICYGK
jgi:hypothetical protein